MTVPSYQVIVYFDFPAAPGNSFQLDGAVAGVLDNTTYTLYKSTPVDVTADVTSVSIQRGSDSLLFPDAVAGIATVTLNNDTSCSLGARTYDPMNTVSPYYGNIIPGRRVDILAGGVKVFTGRIQDWNYSYDVSGRSIATMQCADGLAVLARQEFDAWTATASQLPGARIGAVLDRSEVQWPNARALDTGKSTLKGDDVSFGTNVLSYLNQVTKSDVGLLFVAKDGVLTFKDRHAALNAPSAVAFGRSGASYLSLPGTAGSYASSPDSVPLQITGDIEIVARISMTDWTPTAISTVVGRFRTGAFDWRLYVGTSGELGLQWSPDGISTPFDVSVPTGFTDGKTYWIRARLDVANGANRVSDFYYAGDQENEPLSWTELTTNTTAGTTSIYGVSGAKLTIGAHGATGTNDPLAGKIYRVIVRNGFKDNGGTTVFDADFDYADTSTQTTVSEISTNRATVTLNGSAAFSVQDGIQYSDIEVMYGSETLYNRIVVNSDGFGTNTTLALASQAIYGISSYSTPTLLLSSSTQMSDIGAWLASIYSDPQFRLRSVRVNVHALTTAQQATLLGLDIASVCTVRFWPNKKGDAYQRTSLILAIRDDMLPGSHVRTFSFTDVDSRPFFKLNDSVFGVLNTDMLAF